MRVRVERDWGGRDLIQRPPGRQGGMLPPWQAGRTGRAQAGDPRGGGGGGAGRAASQGPARHVRRPSAPPPDHAKQ
eukprot:scaffold4436_cov14-Prasinocladus_malaysianus.AAC.1